MVHKVEWISNPYGYYKATVVLSRFIKFYGHTIFIAFWGENLYLTLFFSLFRNVLENVEMATKLTQLAERAHKMQHNL